VVAQHRARRHRDAVPPVHVEGLGPEAFTNRQVLHQEARHHTIHISLQTSSESLFNIRLGGLKLKLAVETTVVQESAEHFTIVHCMMTLQNF